MNDTYQAIYDAIMHNWDFQHLSVMMSQQIAIAFSEYSKPSAVYRPRIFIDGNQWCALYGENIQDGVAGFGNSPEKAMEDFDREWKESLNMRQGRK